MLVDQGGESWTLEVWDARSRRRVARLALHDTPTAVRFSPDGRLVAVGYPNGLSQVWSTANWKPVTRLLAGDVGEIHALAISPDSRTLATGSQDRTVRLWDIESQQAIGTPLRGPGAAWARSPVLHIRPGSAHRQLRHGPRLPLELRPESLVRHAFRWPANASPRRMDETPTRPRL